MAVVSSDHFELAPHPPEQVVPLASSAIVADRSSTTKTSRGESGPGAAHWNDGQAAPPAPPGPPTPPAPVRAPPAPPGPPTPPAPVRDPEPPHPAAAKPIAITADALRIQLIAK